MSVTHALVVDSYGEPFSIAEGSEAEMKKAHRSWKTKVFGAKAKGTTVKLPTEDGLPADYRRSAILGLRVIKIPEDVLYRRRIAQDPRNKRFIENANTFDNQAVDILDQGYKG